MEKHIPQADSYQGSPYPNLPPPPSYEESYPSAPPSVAGDVIGGPTVVTVLIDDGKFGPYSKPMRCYHCGEQIATRTETKPGTITYLLCFALCLVGCFCGCCLIPFCTHASQDVMHRCPKCKKYVGSYERFKIRR